jgi:RimJ/RimL family protein N-acetyltransferase
MDLRSARVRIRPWERRDDDVADRWPPYRDPFEALWNLPRQGGGAWGHGFESSAMRRNWAVEDRAGHLIGRISLREIDDRRNQARLGITIGAPYVSQGLGTEALQLFLDYYFTRLGFTRMVLDVAAPNVRAVRCYERLGFRHVGSDWRDVSYAFEARVLDDPRYAGLRRHFRPGRYGLQVEFFEMALDEDEWGMQRRD